MDEADRFIERLPALLETASWPLILYQEGALGTSSWVVQPCIGVAECRDKIAAWLRVRGYRVELSPPDELDEWTMNIYRGHP